MVSGWRSFGLCLQLATFVASFTTPKLVAVKYTAKFDDVNANLVNGVPARGITPLGPYQNLYYNAIGVISDNTTLAGVPPVSIPNVAGFDIVAETQGAQYITSSYTDSITDHFDLSSFYFACLVSSQENDSSKPISCGLNIVGYRKGAAVGRLTANYVVAAGTLQQAMKKVTVGSTFQNLDKVLFSLTPSVTNAAVAALFDNFNYTVYLRQ